MVEIPAANVEPNGSDSEGASRSKQQTIDRLQASAIMLFSQYGFDGTSLRDIATDANVSLSTIDRYFGSKHDLLDALQGRIWKEINQAREDLLRRPVQVRADGKPTLRAILHAFVHPVVQRSVIEKGGAPSIRLLREYVAKRHHQGNKIGPQAVANGAGRWVDAIMQACPAVKRTRAVWILSFWVNVLYSDQLQHGWFDGLILDKKCLTAEELTDIIVDFCLGGTQAIHRSMIEKSDVDGR